jgi:hypothetical protein
MLKGKNEQRDNFAAGEVLRSVIRFRHAKLDAHLLAVPEEFDLIFCPNVLIYFRAETKEEVLRHRLPAFPRRHARPRTGRELADPGAGVADGEAEHVRESGGSLTGH